MRIAILEDDPDQLALLRRWITDDGHDVHAYVSGREAMKMAGRESFDLFMLDWQVPDVTGAEVLMWVRANVSKSVPVLFVSGNCTDEARPLGLGCLAKPYSDKVLKGALDALDRHLQGQRLKSLPPQLTLFAA